MLARLSPFPLEINSSFDLFTLPKNWNFNPGSIQFVFMSSVINVFWSGSTSLSDNVELHPLFIQQYNITEQQCIIFHTDCTPKPISHCTLILFFDEQYNYAIQQQLNNKVIQLEDFIYLNEITFQVRNITIDNKEIQKDDVFGYINQDTIVVIKKIPIWKKQVLLNDSLDTLSVYISSNVLRSNKKKYFKIINDTYSSVISLIPLQIGYGCIHIHPLLAKFFPSNDSLSFICINEHRDLDTWLKENNNLVIGTHAPIILNQHQLLITTKHPGRIRPTTKVYYSHNTPFLYEPSYSLTQPLLNSCVPTSLNKESLKHFHHLIQSIQLQSFPQLISINGTENNALCLMKQLIESNQYCGSNELLMNYQVLSLSSYTSHDLSKLLHSIPKISTLILFLINTTNSTIISTTQRFYEESLRFSYPFIFLFHGSVPFIDGVISFPKEPNKFNVPNQVFGMDKQRQLVTNSIIHTLHPITPLKPSGILLFGPSGCGKSICIQEFIQQHPTINYKLIRAAEVLDKFVGESERKLRDIFNDGVDLLIFEDVDAIGHRRNGDKTDSVVNTLLTMLDGINKRKMVVIATTNRPDLLDPALIRKGRLGEWIYFGLPSQHDKDMILQHVCELTLKDIKDGLSSWTTADVINYAERIELSTKAMTNDEKYNYARELLSNYQPSGSMLDLDVFETFIKGSIDVGSCQTFVQ
ncbi:Nuclear valosin-containing protein [Entamoeba marina]